MLNVTVSIADSDETYATGAARWVMGQWLEAYPDLFAGATIKPYPGTGRVEVVVSVPDTAKYPGLLAWWGMTRVRLRTDEAEMILYATEKARPELPHEPRPTVLRTTKQTAEVGGTGWRVIGRWATLGRRAGNLHGLRGGGNLCTNSIKIISLWNWCNNYLLSIGKIGKIAQILDNRCQSGYD